MLPETLVAGIGFPRTETNANDGEAWVLVYQGSMGAARIAKDEPDMRKDFENSAKTAKKRATELGMKVFD